MHPADVVLENGTIYTMKPARPRAEAVAITGDRIEAVGSAADLAAYKGPHTKVIDLAGRAVTPGLVDGHAHLYGLGKSLEELSLRGVTSEAEAARLAGEAATGMPAGEWIQGRGWDQNLWSPAEFPGRRRVPFGTAYREEQVGTLLDAATPHHPVALRRIDGHAVWVNRLAMDAAHITRDTPDPSGGRIVRDERGDPTGVFVDNAMPLVERVIPDTNAALRRRRILRGAQAAVAAGLTGVHDMGISDAMADTYRQLVLEKRLPLRVHAFLDGAGRMETLGDRRPPREDDDGRAFFVMRGIKLYADGALGSRGAALLEPYSDDPDNRGLTLLSEDELYHAAVLCLEHGWQLAVHAIGDRANRMVLDAIQAVRVPAEARFRIEHAQILSPRDLPRFAKLGVLAGVQFSHEVSDRPWVLARLGAERLQGAYAWRALKASGARLVGGSDFPIEDVSPLRGLAAAVTRPDGPLTLDEALRSYTVEPAYASFEQTRRGRIAAGFMADLTVFDRDLVPETLAQTRVDLTLVGGVIVYDRRR